MAHKVWARWIRGTSRAQASLENRGDVMVNSNFSCTEHSGFVARIANLEASETKQWSQFNKVDARFNSMLTRINLTLGGIAVSCILLVINIAIK